MQRRSPTARGLFIAGFAMALLSSFGCGGDTGGPIPPALLCSDGGTAGANTVVMSCGGLIDATTERVDIVIGGPGAGTSSLRGLVFDVIYDPAKLEFVPAASLASPLFPDGLVAVELANGQEGEIVVAILQVGTLPDVPVEPGEHTVISFSFRRVGVDTFDPTPLTFVRAQAMVATPAITFASGLALAYQ